MPKYAILGATGTTGQCILQLLSASPSTELNIYVRSRAKLTRLLPHIAQNLNIHTFEGPLHDLDLLRACIADVDAVFSVVATNENTRDCSIAQDTARVLVAVLQRVREDAEAKAAKETDADAGNAQQKAPHHLPRIVVLSSLSVNPNFRFHGVFHWLLNKALGNIYEDLRKAEALYREQGDWLQKVVIVTPGALSQDPVRRGHTLSVTETNGRVLSFWDLAAGMIEVAEAEGGRYDGKDVVVNAAEAGTRFPREAPGTLLRGLWRCFWQWVF